MSRLIRHAMRWLTVAYRPHPDERPFLDRAATRSESDLDVTVAVLGVHESERFFGVRMARRGMQPVWIRIVNRTSGPCRLNLFGVDPAYYTPLEAAGLNHFSIGKRLAAFGLLAWMFLPLIPLLPVKLLSARAANLRMNDFFKTHGFSNGPIRPGGEKSGFVFTTLDEGNKNLDVKILAGDQVHTFAFSFDVPGLALGSTETDETERPELEETDEHALRTWLAQRSRATTNRQGNVEGDPLNLVVVGDRATVLQCLGARWDEVETITLATCWKTARSFLLASAYRYAPVSPLYIDGHRQELALQKARASINERIHLRLWRTERAFEGQQVWIGQISRDIGVRFTPKTWNLTTHRIDPDVDEARDYLIDYLMSAGRVSRVGYVEGVGEAPPSAPRHNLTGDPYFTDGLRAVVILSKNQTQPALLSWA